MDPFHPAFGAGPLRATRGRPAPRVRLEARPAPDLEPVLPSAARASLAHLASSAQPGDVASSAPVFFRGPSGVGKTLAARWVAREIGRPLGIVDLSSAGEVPMPALVDEIRRASEAGMVVLVEHIEMLDAGARRRDAGQSLVERITRARREQYRWRAPLIVERTCPTRDAREVWFPMPAVAEREHAIRLLVEDLATDPVLVATVAAFYRGATIRDVVDDVARARRFAVTSRTRPLEALLGIARRRFTALARTERRESALELLARTDLSQRAVHAITGVSRESLRAHRSA